MAHIINVNHISQRDKAEIVNTIKKACDSLNFVVNELNTKTDFRICSLEDLQKMASVDWLRNYIEEQKNKFLGNAEYIPKNLREQIETSFEQSYRRNERFFEDLENRYKRLNGVEIGFSQNTLKFYVDSDNLNKYAEQIATVKLPEHIRTYYTKLGEFFEAYKAIQQYEKEYLVNGISDGYNSAEPNGNTFHVPLSKIFRKGNFVSTEDFVHLYKVGVIR